MWLFNSSIGKKVIMAVTGMALILFLTFHMSMNVVALFSAEGYNMICEMLGANWYAVVATLALAALAVIHIIYAFILTMQNRAARGTERYAVTDKPSKVEWASQNMLVLGLIVLFGLGMHLYDFWAKMMLVDLTGNGDLAHSTVVPPVTRLLEHAADNGSERQGVVHTLEGNRHRIRYRSLPRLCRCSGMVLYTECYLVN